MIFNFAVHFFGPVKDCLCFRDPFTIFEGKLGACFPIRVCVSA